MARPQGAGAVADREGVTCTTDRARTATRAIHVGRQPVYDRLGDVVGYELLFRGERRGRDGVRGATRSRPARSSSPRSPSSAWTSSSATGRASSTSPASSSSATCRCRSTPARRCWRCWRPSRSTTRCAPASASWSTAATRSRWTTSSGASSAARLLPMATYVKLDMLDNDPATLRATVRKLPRVPRPVAGRRAGGDRGAAGPGVRARVRAASRGTCSGRPHVISRRGLVAVAAAPARAAHRADRRRGRPAQGRRADHHRPGAELPAAARHQQRRVRPDQQGRFDPRRGRAARACSGCASGWR